MRQVRHLDRLSCKGGMRLSCADLGGDLVMMVCLVGELSCMELGSFVMAQALNKPHYCKRGVNETGGLKGEKVE